MPNGVGLPIDLETFEKLDSDARQVAIFKVLVYMHDSGFECAEDRAIFRKTCQDRISKLEQRKWINTSASGIGGLLGGIGAAWAYLKGLV